MHFLQKHVTWKKHSCLSDVKTKAIYASYIGEIVHVYVKIALIVFSRSVICMQFASELNNACGKKRLLFPYFMMKFQYLKYFFQVEPKRFYIILFQIRLLFILWKTAYVPRSKQLSHKPQVFTSAFSKKLGCRITFHLFISFFKNQIFCLLLNQKSAVRDKGSQLRNLLKSYHVYKSKCVLKSFAEPAVWRQAGDPAFTQQELF